jgi:hypothetical protein
VRGIARVHSSRSAIRASSRVSRCANSPPISVFLGLGDGACKKEPEADFVIVVAFV